MHRILHTDCCSCSLNSQKADCIFYEMFDTGGEVRPGQDPKESLKESLTNLLCKETDGTTPDIDWKVSDVVSRLNIYLPCSHFV